MVVVILDNELRERARYVVLYFILFDDAQRAEAPRDPSQMTVVKMR